MDLMVSAKTPRTAPLPELDDLAEQIGDFIQYWGFKRVHGKIWTHLILSERPLDAADLIERLKISKALVSMSLKDLLSYNVILVAGKSQAGTVLYTANPDVSGVILNVLRQRERRMMARLSAAVQLLKNLPAKEHKRHALDREKLNELGKLIQNASRALDTFLTGFRLDLSILRKLPLLGMRDRTAT